MEPILLTKLVVSCEEGHPIEHRYRGPVERDQNRGTCLCRLRFKPKKICTERGYNSLVCSDCKHLIVTIETEKNPKYIKKSVRRNKKT